MTLPATFNLARRPFVNRRPVGRLAIALWVVGVALVLWNARLYLELLPGRHRSPQEQRQLERQIVEQREAISELRARVARFDIAQMEDVASFVNRCIADRTFSWSALFDQVSGVLPNEVRLLSLSPEASGESAKRARTPNGAEGAGVLLDVRGVAKSDEALLGFIDNLFSHELFRSPDLKSERKLEQGDREFALSVVYDPSKLSVAAAAPSPEEPAAETPEEAPAADEGGGAAQAERSPA